MSFNPITTQEQFDEMIATRLERERKAVTEQFSDYDSIKEQLASKTQELADLGNSLTASNDKLKEHEATISELQGKLHTHETNSVKMRIAQEFGLDLSLANRLTGDTEEDIRKDAEALKNVVGTSQIIQVPLGSTEPDKKDPYRELLKGLKGE